MSSVNKALEIVSHPESATYETLWELQKVQELEQS